MAVELKKGEKRSLSDLGVGEDARVEVDFGLDGIDVAAFGLGADRKIGDDRWVVLFSNAASPDGAMRGEFSDRGARFDFALGKLPATVDRIVLTATHDARPVSESRPLTVKVGEAAFDVAAGLSGERAVMMAELYRHASGWKLGTIAQGFEGGLGALIEHFGGEVADEPPAPAAAAPTPATSTPAAPPPSKLNLSKIKLEKDKPSISLEKTGASFGEIVLNLNWSAQPQKKGFFGGTKQLDLDLGCLFELEGGAKGVIQALGKSFGRYDAEPFIELSGDDRSGSIDAGETIRINGTKFDRIRRLAVFALIYDGAPNWQATDGVVRITMPGQPEIEVRMNEQDGGSSRLCGIATIENEGGKLRIERLVKFYRDQKQYADDQGIVLRWARGSKD